MTRPDTAAPVANPQQGKVRVIDSKGAVSRKRLREIHRGALAEMDAAMEARHDSEEPAREYSLREVAAVFEFAHRTRRMVRALEAEILRRAA